MTKKNSAWKRKRQAMRNKKLKHTHHLKRLTRNRRSKNNLNAYEKSNYAGVYGWDKDSPFYEDDRVQPVRQPVRKGFYKVNSDGSRSRADKKVSKIMKKLMAGKYVSEKEINKLRQ